MLLGAHETVLRSAYAVLEPGPHGARRRPGVLYLTTERIVFEAAATRGVVRDLLQGRHDEIVAELPLGALRNAAVRSGRLARSRLVVDAPSGRAVFDVLEPESWTVAISEARQRDALRREPPGAAAPAPGRPAVKLRCRYCGSLGDEENRRCPSCGAPL